MAKAKGIPGRDIVRKRKSGNSQLTKGKANAVDYYAKRQARNAKTSQTSDVYEYLPEKTRRSKVTLDLDREEAQEFRIEGIDNDEREALRARLIGENADDEEIDSGDDEEIDSDAAFEESDDERFAGLFSKKKKKFSTKEKKGVRFATVDLNEDEDVEEQQKSEAVDTEEEEGGDDDEFIDILDVLDGKGEIDMGSEDGVSAPEGSRNTLRIQEANEVEEDVVEEDVEEEDSPNDDETSGSEGDEDDEKIALIPSDNEDESPEALEELQKFISNLDPTAKKRKVPEDDAPVNDAANRPRKRRLIKEYNETGPENEFRARPSDGSKLNLDDLLAPLASQPSALLPLKNSTKLLTGSSKAKTLSAPLPQRTKERLDREAAYEQTKEEVDKWSGTMKRIREAEHLSFPLQSKPTGRVSNLELAAKFKPSTALESSVDALLKSAKMRDEDIQKTEDSMLQMNNVSVEEVAQRRAELRQMRELMFRAEIKARRVAKIKSKTYRRIKRKEKERLGELINEDEGSEAEEGRLKREVDRAKERATLRHKHTGKWSKQMRGRQLDEGGRKEVEEMLARGEKLRRRIQGIGSDDSESGGEDDDDDDVVEDDRDGIEKIKQNAFDELQRLEKQDVIAHSKAGKSIFEMKFMKDAMAREQQVTEKGIDDFVNEMGGRLGEAESDAEEESETPKGSTSNGVVAQRMGGRVVFYPGAASKKQPVIRKFDTLPSDTSSTTLKSTDLLSPTSPITPHLQRPNVLDPTPPVNPWLVRDSDITVKASRKLNEVVVSKDSKTMDKAKNKIKKQFGKRQDVREQAEDDAVLHISPDAVLTLPSTPAPSASLITNGKGKQKVAEEDNDSDANSELEIQETSLQKNKGKSNGPIAFTQREMVALAFAGDNVIQEFEETKRREVAADAPREVDTTIPGWGAWGGTGLQKAPPKPQRIKKIAGIDPTSRADHNKKHIIISEKRDKKAAKYLVKDLPYPYTSKAQFERTMEQPLGVEWNTRIGFQRGTLPKVVKKPGVIINPLEKLV